MTLKLPPFRVTNLRTIQPMRKAFTIIELLVVVSIIGLLVAILLPAIGKARDSALLTQSQSNLRAIVQAAGIYGADFQDRQWTAVAENIGGDPVFAKCSNFANSRCSAQLILGFGPSADTSITKPVPYGFIIPQSSDCGTKITQGNCNVEKAYWPCDFDLTNTGNFGSWRLTNAKSFNKYSSNKFYSPIFYAPKDKVTLEKAQPFIESGIDFTGPVEKAVLSSYCWSPAAMWGPDVLSKINGYSDPAQSKGGFRSPAVSQSSFPELKTRVMEHQWLQNKPNMELMEGSMWPVGQKGGSNPDSFSPRTRTGSSGMPWFFNQGGPSTPAVAFFDGHVGSLGVPEAIDSYKRIAFGDSKNKAIKYPGSYFGGSGGGNFAASFPMPGGYKFGAYDNIAYNGGNSVSYHVLTSDGIRGRDTIGQK